MKPDELASGMAQLLENLSQGQEDRKLCRQAASFFGEQSADTKYLDNTGRIGMSTFELSEDRHGLVILVIILIYFHV